MRKSFGKWCLALSLMLAAGVAGTTVCYGQDEVEISDFEDEISEDVDLDTSEDVPDTETVDAEEFDDGDTAEAVLSDDEGVIDAGADTSGTYAHSDSATSGGVTLTIEWNEPVLGEETTFHVSATGGSGRYKFYMETPSYKDFKEQYPESVADASQKNWPKYTSECKSYDFSFKMTASGTYNFKFHVMDMNDTSLYLRTNTDIQVLDENHPSVDSIVSSAVVQCNLKTDGSDYKKALWLHDWLLEQLEYDNSLIWSSAESALTRHTGTCQAYESAYSKLLKAAGIENAETRDTYDGHTWNAMKLDGEWYQVDCTWDDSSSTGYYSFDRKHLYFGLTDELMAIAHEGHANIYTAAGYATRSTSLADNYFVKSGDAAEWANSYADRIQQELDAGKTEFTIDADNKSYPPGISGIQNGIIAYALNQMEWYMNGEKVALQATGAAEQFTFTVSSITGEKFYGYSLNLEGTIAINMYMELPDTLINAEDAYMEFTFPNGSTSKVWVKDAVQKKGYYVFSVRVVAKEMSQDIKVRMHAGNELGKQYTVSVQKYAEYIIKHPEKYSSYSVNLVKSLLNYGASAQNLFAYDTDNLANENLSDEDKVIKPVDFSAYRYVLNQDSGENGIKWYGGSLILESDTAIRDYFSLDSSEKISNYTFESGGVKLEPKETILDGKTCYYVEIPDIKAKKLDQAIVVTVKREDKEVLSLQYNAFSYACTLKQDTAKYEKTITVTNAMYQYWKMAKEYFENKQY